MAAQPLSLSGPEKIETTQPATSASRRFRGLHLVTNAKYEAPVEKVDTMAQARRIVAQVEYEIQQQAARERDYRNNRWRAPIAPQRSHTGFFGRLRKFAGI